MGFRITSRPPNIISKAGLLYGNYSEYTWTAADVIGAQANINISAPSLASIYSYAIVIANAGGTTVRPPTDMTSVTSQITGPTVLHVNDPAGQINENDFVRVVYWTNA